MNKEKSFYKNPLEGEAVGAPETKLREQIKIENQTIEDTKDNISVNDSYLKQLLPNVANEEDQQELLRKQAGINQAVKDADKNFQREIVPLNYEEVRKSYEELGDAITVEELDKWAKLNATQKEQMIFETSVSFQGELGLDANLDAHQKKAELRQALEGLNQNFGTIIEEYQEVLKKTEKLDLQDENQVQKLEQMFDAIGQEAALYTDFLKCDYILSSTSERQDLAHPLTMSIIQQMEGLTELKHFNLKQEWLKQLDPKVMEEILAALQTAIMKNENAETDKKDAQEEAKGQGKWLMNKTKTGALLVGGGLGWLFSKLEKRIISPEILEKLLGFIPGFKIPRWIHTMYGESQNKPS